MQIILKALETILNFASAHTHTHTYIYITHLSFKKKKKIKKNKIRSLKDFHPAMSLDMNQ